MTAGAIVDHQHCCLVLTDEKVEPSMVFGPFDDGISALTYAERLEHLLNIGLVAPGFRVIVAPMTSTRERA